MAYEVKSYLDYLEKEMTIMGVLSTFCVGMPALTIERVAGADGGTNLAKLWSVSDKYMIVGSVAMLIAALYFYRQRSRLAWHFGQICLAVSPYHREVDKLVDQLADADSWATWISYRTAFVFTGLGFLEYGIALARFSRPSLVSLSNCHAIYFPWITAIAFSLIQWAVLTRYSQSPSPWLSFIGADRTRA